MDSALLTPKEVCQRLKIHRNTLRHMIDRGQVHALNISQGKGRPTWRIVADSLHDVGRLEEQVKALDIERRLGL